MKMKILMAKMKYRMRKKKPFLNYLKKVIPQPHLVFRKEGPEFVRVEL